jgi:hypothetical protein
MLVKIGNTIHIKVKSASKMILPLIPVNKLVSLNDFKFLKLNLGFLNLNGFCLSPVVLPLLKLNFGILMFFKNANKFVLGLNIFLSVKIGILTKLSRFLI